jgi:hypothetical protein
MGGRGLAEEEGFEPVNLTTLGLLNHFSIFLSIEDHFAISTIQMPKRKILSSSKTVRNRFNSLSGI